MTRILVIEDELSIQKVIKANLAASGYSVSTACSGEQGLELMHADRPDMVLLDLLMPGISGWDVLETMKEYEELAQIPVIVITASGWGDGEKKLRVKGVRHYLSKPFDLNELLDKVSIVFKESE